MPHWAWYIVVGCVLLVMGLSASWVRRVPVTTSIIYLVLGAVLGPLALGAFDLDPVVHAKLLELLTEISVSLSLFTAGLKLRLPWRHPRWLVCLRLAISSMTLTVGMIALAGVVGLGLPWGAAILLGAILAPTDPVLASDIQVRDIEDRDALRLSLTGEAGLNDGAAFPFVMLGLGLLGLHDIGPWGVRWLLVDVVWAVSAGLGMGALLGMLAARGIVYLRKHHKEAVVLDDFLALGLLALAYGAALAIHAYAFLAAFAAGASLRMVERVFTGEALPMEIKEVADAHRHEQAITRPEHAPAYAAQAILLFNEQLERLGEVGMVVLLGGMLGPESMAWSWSGGGLWFIPLFFLIIRPLSVFLGIGRHQVSRGQLALIGWFGIRGIGSLYYLSYAVAHGLPGPITERIVPVVLSTVAASILVHGISVNPLLSRAQKASA